MKRISCITLLILGSFNIIFSQWSIKNIDENSTTNFNTIKFKNDTLGFYMGENSVILKTEDSGETWVKKETTENINIFDFQFLEDSLIYAVGDYQESGGYNRISKLIISADNGESWESISSFYGKQLYSLYFISKDSGILAGYDGIYRTVDLGINWDTVWSVTSFGYQYGSVNQMHFPSKNTGFAVGHARTTDNDNNLFDNFILKTIDSGITWDTVSTLSNELTTCSIITLNFVNQDTGFIGTDCGHVLKTTDGGLTWSGQRIAEGHEINSIMFVSPLTGFLVGSPCCYPNSYSATIFFISKTVNGGNTWETYDTVGVELSSIFYLNDSIGFVSGSYSLIMKTQSEINILPEDYPWHLVGSGTYTTDQMVTEEILELYPNPAETYLNIRFRNEYNSPKSIKILNIQGGLICSGQSYETENSLLKIDISDLKPGIYLIQIGFAEHFRTMKFLKK